MRVLLDTNVLCRRAERGHPQHAEAEFAVTKLHGAGHDLCLVPQILCEYWVVATRPASENGLDMPPGVADKAIDLWLELFLIFRDERGIFSRWRELVRQYEVKGKCAHDARIVAAMQRHSLTQLLTFNSSDFRRFPGIELLDPNSLVAM